MILRALNVMFTNLLEVKSVDMANSFLSRYMWSQSGTNNNQCEFDRP